MNELRVGLAGLGTVGSGVIKMLHDDAERIAVVAGCPIRVSAWASRTPKPALTGDIPMAPGLAELPQRPDVDVVVEVIGGEDDAAALARATFAAGKPFVTANKALIARHGTALFQEAAAAGVDLRYESSVVAGVPVIKALREGLAANRVGWIAGIINGTSNFILTRMEREGREFADVLAEAQALGYAEADPTFDIEGIDAAHKLAILASIGLRVPLDFPAVATRGIAEITTEDLDYATQLGYRIKHLAIARAGDRGVELRVHPALTPVDHLLANIDGVSNAVMFGGHAAGPVTLVGAGAGSLPTASGVLADLIDIAQGNAIRGLGVAPASLHRLPMLPLAEVETAHYLRILVSDRPGVLSLVSDTLGKADISIDAVIQKQQKQPETGPSDDNRVPIVLITNRCRDEVMERAVQAVRQLDEVRADIVRIRVEHFDS